ncbi:hypothetical protein Skr01_61800 [Sphaerisporangium krabiense]|uniref:NACHT domain-containing protein n=1 Tax=Sphaerisporangium krabiense TaxID=763782 RepID=A0A7W8Z2J6_9ACTN|nr:NACHT domain-containing protein [Sphaerisporangium krabiense]MBB5626239.1 hypothetical protein [Sphaerisporangium krabiense]GII66095.1 hypothetical protein Skr01_61800 [Sphaerisporangium krabiense]
MKRWARASLLVVAISLFSVLCSVAANQVFDGREWSRHWGVVAMAFSLAGTALTMLVFPRFDPARRGEEARAPAHVRLARRVHRQEKAARDALLGPVVPAADVAFDALDGEPPGGLADGLARRTWQTAVRLLSWRETTDEEGDGAAGTLEDITGFYDGLSDGRLVIVGDKGSGKTILAIHLVMRRAKAIMDDPDAKDPVPVRLSAASWTTDRPLSDWLADQVKAYGLSAADATRLVEERRILPVLDGLDEMDPEPSAQDARTAPRRAAALLAALNTFYAAEEHTYAPVVVTTRPGRHADLDRHEVTLDRARTVAIRPLTVQQITGYLTERYRGRLPKARRAWEPLLAALEKDDGLRRLLATPWRMMLAATAIEADPAVAAGLLRGGAGRADGATPEPALLAAFVPAAVRAAGGRHRPEQVERWLAHLARHLDWQDGYAGRHPPAPEPPEPRRAVPMAPYAFAGDMSFIVPVPSESSAPEPDPRLAPTEMSAVDIVPHLLWPMGGSLAPRLVHAGLAVAAMLAAGATVTGLTSFGDVTAWVSHLAHGQWMPAAWQAVGLLLTGFAVAAVAPVFGVWWRPPSVRTRAKVSFHDRRQGMDAGLGLGLMGGLMCALPMALTTGAGGIARSDGQAGLWLQPGIGTGLKTALAVVVSIMLFSGAAGWFFVGLDDRRRAWESWADLDSPQRAIRDDLRAGVAAGLAFGVVLGGIAGVIGGPALGLRTGLFVGIAIGLMAGGTAARYAIAVPLAALRGRLPWRVASFCRWACAAGLLRTAGTAYQFRHRELQSWLARNR